MGVETKPRLSGMQPSVRELSKRAVIVPSTVMTSASLEHVLLFPILRLKHVNYVYGLNRGSKLTQGFS